ncbi:mucin TcMUCII, putative [Trypanosoma cruzi marinkellei]|uniref:Mucin TcMUCII, putative n=1 Tax=Trypanosoma cruzi marinkellei TaxID=85056 RepID=K2MP83_TRYCR|nr:mucin TcMUCII, putative [Trypanosoma cruzi marinkellei]
MMMTCRLLCALLVLALCCCPSVCMAEDDGDPPSESVLTITPPGGKGVSGSLAGTPDSPAAVTPESNDPPKTVQQQANISGTDVSGLQGASSTVLTGGENEKSQGSGSGPAPPGVSGPVAVTAEGPYKISLNTTKQGQGGLNTGETSSSGNGTIQNPSEEVTEETKNEDGGEPPSGARSDKGEGTSTVPALPEGTDTTTGPTSTEQGPSGSANPTAQIGTNGTVTVQSQEENMPNTTTTTTTTTAPEAPSTTTTEAPTTTTTGAPSRLPEIDGSLSSSAWVSAPLLLAVSALAYTTLG